VPLGVSLLAAVVCLAAGGISLFGRQPKLPLLYLALGILALGAAHQHWYREEYAADDIGSFASQTSGLAQIRGVLDEEPATVAQPLHDPWISVNRSEPTLAVLHVSHLKQAEDWMPVSGRAQLAISAPLAGLHVGDEIEVVGRLTAPHGPANPGEADRLALLRDQRIRAELSVRKTPDAVTRLTEGWPHSLTGWLAICRNWGERELRAALPDRESRLAAALLLGKGGALTNDDWQKYIHTGVVHILIIAGLHLMSLALFAWWLLRLLGVSRSRGAWIVALFLLGYALLSGGRPPAMRAAVVGCAYCGALILRRQTMAANSLALAWLALLAWNPTTIFDPGCQMSFLSVVVLYWGPARWFRRSSDPLDRLIEESRPPWQRALRRFGRGIVWSYATTWIVWAALAPLTASRYHLISFSGLLLGPPVMAMALVAVVTGFLSLASAVFCPPLVPLFAWPTCWSLTACDTLVQLADGVPASHCYLGTIPEWWLIVFYLVLLAALTHQQLQQHWRWLALAGLGWVCLGLLTGAAQAPADELRCTFLAVGHGGCTVLETPDGRTLLYDAGALAGPDVTRRQIAPFLWHRGIRRIDEIFLSHADLDHFNGLPDLLERFAVGQVTCTPTFKDKPTPAVHETLAALERYHIPQRIVRAGDRLSAGAVAIQVLHPPPEGPPGNENARSMVLLVEHAGHSLLLTGDLEGSGLERVLGLESRPVDVLQAPHHGSRVSNKPELAAWAQPKVVVSCEGPPRNRERPPEPYTATGAHFLGTWPHGAVTLHSHPSGLVVETFMTGQRFVVRRGSGR
jgi:competence protein ComEC